MSVVQSVEGESEPMVSDGIRVLPVSDLAGLDVSDPESGSPTLYEGLIERGTKKSNEALYAALMVNLHQSVRSQILPFLAMEIRHAYEAGLADGYVQGVAAEAERKAAS